MASKKIPIIAHIHVNNNIGVSSLIKNIIWTLFVKKYRHIFWVSDSAYSQFQCKKLVQEKSSVLYNVIDMQSLCKKADKDDLTYDYDVVYVGRLSYQKDPERLMHILHNACIKEKGLKVAIVGNGEYEQYVMDYIQSHELVNNIDYLGYLNNPLKLIKMSKVLLMTSRFEGTPMVALEAQCLGVPVVSTPVDGIKKIIINGYNGYLVDNDDELIKHLIEITSNAEKQKELSRNSLMQAIKYNDLNKYYEAIMHRYNSK
jgi:glycosyltransferase involved in cell wall biosynthesis